MKKALVLALSLLLGFMYACQGETTQATTTATYVTYPDCGYELDDQYGSFIPLAGVTASKSTMTGSVANFLDPCNQDADQGLYFSESLIKTHQVTLALDASYPILEMVITQIASAEVSTIETISVDYSLNGVFFTRLYTDLVFIDDTLIVPFSGQNARYVRLIFPAVSNETFGIEDVNFYLSSGLIVEEDPEWTDAFLRYDTWTGADGIFAFNLNGDDSIGALQSETAFIFSDTFTGSVNPTTGLRTSNRMINNSLAYYDGSHPVGEGLTFACGETLDGLSRSAYLPDSYIGYHPNNLLSANGLDISYSPLGRLGNEANGSMWLSPYNEENYLIFDFNQPVDLDRIYLWNYNADFSLGVENFDLETSTDGSVWAPVGSYTIDTATGFRDEPYTLRLETALQGIRYLKLDITSGYDPDYVGLGKILFLDAEGMLLFPQVEASNYEKTISGNETTARLWLQDGVVIGDYFYDFPLVVKDTVGFFEITGIGLSRTEIVDGRLDFNNATYYAAPLYTFTPDGGVISFGAGVMNNVDIDGYIYIYGYKDLGGRHLVVARVHPESFTDFNSWTYFDGSKFTSDINASMPLIEGVSAELSVTYLESGLFAGQYMLVVMEDTLSGKVSYALSATPTGPFSTFHLLYQTVEHTMYNGAYTYNAKLHAHLSEPGNYLISYNVNTSNFSALANVNIYHPRFIRVREVLEP